MAKEGGGNQRGWGKGVRPEGRCPGLSRAVPTVSLRWTKLPPVRPAARGQAPVVPYMRYGHSTVLIDDTVFLWGGRNDTEGACNVLYAFDVSEYGSQSGCVLPDGASGGLGRVCAEGAGSKVPWSLGGSVSLLTGPALCPLQILTSGQHPECQERFLGPGMDIRLVSWARPCTFLGATSSW